MQEISDTLRAIRQQSAGGVDDRKLADACLRGMTKTLDRSEFLDVEDFRELQVGSAPLGGVGIEFKPEADRLIIVSTLEGSPASRTDLGSGDAIRAIDDTPIRDLSAKEIVKLLRGEPGSVVKLTVSRDGIRDLMEFTLTREAIAIESVKRELPFPGYAHIRITRFDVSTVEKLASAMASSYAANGRALNGLVLDLRNNPGGLLNACIGVSAAFLFQNAFITHTDGRTEDSRMRLYARPEYYVRQGKPDPFKTLPSAIKTVPMAVLVNHVSAACSEIVAAALQDHKRATLLGERTFGLGLVQTILPLQGNTALKLTTARFFRPNGKPIGSIGVTPDVVTGPGNEPGTGSQVAAARDPVLTQAIEVLRSRAPSPTR